MAAGCGNFGPLWHSMKGRQFLNHSQGSINVTYLPAPYISCYLICNLFFLSLYIWSFSIYSFYCVPGTVLRPGDEYKGHFPCPFGACILRWKYKASVWQINVTTSECETCYKVTKGANVIDREERCLWGGDIRTDNQRRGFDSRFLINLWCLDLGTGKYSVSIWWMNELMNSEKG